ncbi:elongation factor 1-gamma [Strigomonas culicis]|nr:elongation factor 1-gamma [Strigomonas culicis]|eukprot:EPY29488.1 elongation factor 1-gamma [Strigomonas culicis]
MSLTLWTGTHNENARTQKILVAAAFAGVQVTIKGCTYGTENECASFARNFSPCMRYPALQTEEGAVFESNAILRHIARIDKSGAKLYGATPFESSQVDAWLDFATTEIDASNLPYLAEFFHSVAAPKEALARVEEALTGLELWLETRTFLVGERMTIADIAVAFALQWTYRINVHHGEELAKKYKNAYRLYNTVMQQEKTVEVLKSCGATFGPHKAAKKEEKKEKKEEKKEKKEKKPAADDDEDDVPRETKKANPLDLLPPSKLVLDAFKREYSNNDTRAVAAPWFFNNYDPEGYTCFWCKYKYNEDNKVPFMTANLVRGWFQRMEHTRKYAFGVALIIGEEKGHEIVGFWVFRGKGMPEIVTEVVDTENFDWTEIADIQKEKEQITDYLAWEGPTIPRPVLEGRVFK